MARTIRKVKINLPTGFEGLYPVFNVLMTDIFSRFDILDDGSVVASSLFFDEDTSTLTIGNAEIGAGSNINVGAKVTNQRVLPTLNYANVGSVQSAVPITATADAVIATVSIASHSVAYGGSIVVYSAGTVIGVPVSTDVYIYADDPDLLGGAVTYHYTLSPFDMAGALGRYKVGVIRTPVSSISATLSAATQANPCAVTTGAPHLLTTGDIVDFSGVVGMVELNTLPVNAITVTGASTFTLNGVNSTGFGAYISGGTVVRVSTPNPGIGGAGADGAFYDPSIFY